MKDKKETTKEKLIQVGIEAFAAKGFEGTTTRMIAEKAKCNIAAIPYYFGSKEGLYLAVFERISDFPAPYLNPHIEAIHTFLDSTDRNPEKALELLKQLLGTMAELFCSHPKISWHAKLISREQLDPSPAFDMLYEKVIRREVDLISQLISAITGEVNQRTNALQAFILIGQVMIFHHGREAIVRHLGFEGYSTAETDEIRKLITGWIDKTLIPDQQ